MLKNFAMIIGLVLLLIGILGCFPSTAPDGMLFNLIKINSLNNLIHMGLGLFALWMGLQGREPSRSGFRLLSLAFAALSILGFIYGNENILGLIANNTLANWLNLALAVLTFYLGFFYQERYVKV